ncbi:hypothetical protein EDB92DRAFT_1858919 [Lactarius akahatsu]|uniref:Protein YOP1 n=1 Tax=Lactarius akahatsu TaxID=416441 RepID=A0AAD4LLL6_9AGAM|nr:hypothetical protein EDB92DRAFT_1858919 [Lactarius akahatsu]
MLVFIVSRLLTGWFVFLLPSYSTFKALKQRPLNEREVEKVACYWTVVGTLVAFEYTCRMAPELVCSAILGPFPFYWETKTLFLLFLSQFEGSTHIYKSYLEPFFVQNENDIDATIASARDETVQFLHSRISALWDIIYSFLSKTPITQQPSPFTSRDTPTNLSPQKALQSIQNLFGVATPPSFLAPSVHRSRPVSEDTSPLAHPNGVAVPAGYDVGEKCQQLRKNLGLLEQIRIRQATSLLLVFHVFKRAQKKHIVIILPCRAKGVMPRRWCLSGLTTLYSITGAPTGIN